MSRPISDPVFDIGRDLQRAYDEGYKQGRYDEKVGKEMSLPIGRREGMTREEAIEILNCYDMTFYDLYGSRIPAGKVAEAFDMAIEALKERPKGEWLCSDDISGG